MRHHHDPPGTWLVTWTKGGSHPPSGPVQAGSLRKVLAGRGQQALGFGYRVGGQQARASGVGEGAGCARAGQGERDLACEPREVTGEPVETVRYRGGEDDDAGVGLPGRTGELRDGGAGAEVFHPPAAAVQHDTEDQQAHVMLLTGGAGEDGPPPVAVPPSPGEAGQPPAQQVAGEVLTGDADLPAFPAVPE